MADAKGDAELPVVTWRVEWADPDSLDHSNWVQWHDSEDPPGPWDDEEPTAMLALVSRSDAQARINALTDDRDSWMQQATARAADAVAFGDQIARLESQLELAHEAIKTAIVLSSCNKGTREIGYAAVEAKRVPLTRDEVKEACLFQTKACRAVFNQGVRFAERAHGIGSTDSGEGGAV